VEAVIYGNLTLDRNTIGGKTYISPGGTSYFTSKILHNLNLKVFVFSHYGNDFPQEKLSGIHLIPEKPKFIKTLVFKNNYKKNGERIQTISFSGSSALPDVSRINKKLISASPILIVAPILNNISRFTINKLTGLFPKSLKVLVPQGFFRRVAGGNIILKGCQIPLVSLQKFDVIVVSENDCRQIDEVVRSWKSLSTIVIVTRGQKPATVYHRGKRKEYPAFPAVIIRDETGAGDIFAAAFAYAYKLSANLDLAMYFSHAAAALSLPLFPYEIKYGKREIVSFAEKNKKSISL